MSSGDLMSHPRITSARTAVEHPLAEPDGAPAAARPAAAPLSTVSSRARGMRMRNPLTSDEFGTTCDHIQDALELDIANTELRYVVDALARCLDDNERLRGELDAANDAVSDLLAELDEAREAADWPMW